MEGWTSTGMEFCGSDSVGGGRDIIRRITVG